MKQFLRLNYSIILEGQIFSFNCLGSGDDKISKSILQEDNLNNRPGVAGAVL